MIVINSSDVEAVANKEGDPMVAKGPVYMRRLIDPNMAGGSSVLLVTFGRGARLNFHTHTAEQFLYITEGKGIIATEKEEQVVTPGTLVIIPPGEVHWHGATEDSSFTHFAMCRGETKVTQ